MASNIPSLLRSFTKPDADGRNKAAGSGRADGSDQRYKARRSHAGTAIPVTIAIIGDGAASTAAKRALIEKGNTHSNIRLDILQFGDCPEEEDGAGIAWRKTPYPLNLLVNMDVNTLGVHQTRKGEISKFMCAQGVRCDSRFPRRADVGRFLLARNTATDAMAAGTNVRIERIRARVSDLIPQGGKIYVCANGASYRCDAVVLATGNVPSAGYGYLNECPGFVGNPWNLTWIDQIHADDRVIIAGTSVTAVDVVNALVDRPGGHEGPIYAVSRSGRLPGARPLHKPTQLRVLREGRIKDLAQVSSSGAFSIDSLQQLVAAEFEVQDVGLSELRDLLQYSRLDAIEWLAYTLERCNRPSESFGIQKALDSVIPEIWHHCDLATKHTIARQLGDLSRIQWPMAPYNAEMLVRRLRGGQLEVHACVEEPRWAGQDFVVEVKHRRLLHGDWFINATGIGGRLDGFACPLTRQMRVRGLAVPHPVWGARSDFQTGRLLNRRGGPTGSIWSGASALTRGTRLLTNELGEATQSAARAAESALDYVIRQR